MKSIAVYCGSSGGTNGVYREEAAKAGRFLAENNIHLVYGGGKVGLMGELADAALETGGKVTGVIPRFMDPWEVGHKNLSEIIYVETMHERKALIHEMSEGAIALPGGYGTLDELFEILTWGQLDLHNKPVGLLNIHGYFNHILSAINHMVDEGFLKKINHDMLLTAEGMDDLYANMKAYIAPSERKWIIN